MGSRTQLAPLMLWIARLVWATLPVTAGVAAADALDDWSSAPGLLAAGFLWSAWAIGLVALFAPRPLGLTALRAIAPCFFGLGLLLAITEGSGSSWWAAAAAALAAVVVLSPWVSIAAANGAAYGDERRFPLATPPVLFVGPLVVAPPIIAAGLVTGPLLLADTRFALGLVALLGLPVAVLAARSLHTLARRFVVLVPAGIALVDPFTLADPVLFPRDRITSLRAVEAARAPAETLDLRLGAVNRSVGLTLDRATDALQVRRGRGGSETATTTELWFAAVGRRDLLDEAGARRIRVR